MRGRPSAQHAALKLAVMITAGSALALPGTAGAVAPGTTLDVRAGLRSVAIARPTAAVRTTAARSAPARRALAAALGPRAQLHVDPLTGTVESLQRLDGALSAPSTASPQTIADSYTSAHATALGLSTADLRTLHPEAVRRTATGLAIVRYVQRSGGIPAFDNGLQVAVDHRGRVLSVSGTPRTDLDGTLSTTPQISRDQALSAVDPSRRALAPQDSTGHLVFFGARTPHLAWHVTERADSTHWWDAVVDADTGALLYRANLVADIDASIFRNHPGAANGGTQETASLTDPGWLGLTALTLNGPNVHAFADVNDDNAIGLTEEVVPGRYAFTPNATAPASACTFPCTWDPAQPRSWATNKNQNVVQTFWFANHFHDHLVAAPIGFTREWGNFEGTSDKLMLNALDGASTAGNGGPDLDHVNNANMATPPNGQNPVMQMYLFSRTDPLSLNRFRDIDGGDDAAILYHEYTHGLSGRLITHDGTAALNSPQAGAMGEAWSDFYAMDLLVAEGLVTDVSGQDGDIDMGRYSDRVRHTLRTEAMDCAVSSANATACPGTSGTGGTGGYTYADFGRIVGEPEVHADGEIWGQTLWQIRQSLGSTTTEELVTDAMRLSVPEPSFLDMRNAILLADTNDFGGIHHDALWTIFAERGMGFYAGTDDGNDASPAADFQVPPSSSTPPGTITGTVTSAQTAGPLTGTDVGIGGLSTGPGFEPNFATSTDGAGHYTLSAVPAGTYPRLKFTAPGGYDALSTPVTVNASQTTTTDVALTRDWSAVAGGAQVIATNDDTGGPFGCGAAAAFDQDRQLGWSAYNADSANRPAGRDATPPTLTLQLPTSVDVSLFGVDPAATCGDDDTATTRDYRIETSPDGRTWTVAREGSFAPADAGTLVPLAPTAGAAGVRYVRVTLLSPQSTAGSGADFIDLSELEVYGSLPGSSPPTTTTTTTTITPAPGTTTPTTTTTTTPASSTAIKRAPTLSTARRATRHRVRVTVTCLDACRLSGRLTVSSALRRRLHLLRRTVATLTPRTITGTRVVTLTLSSRTVAAMRRRGIRRIDVSLRLTARVSDGPTRTLLRSIRVTR